MSADLLIIPGYVVAFFCCAVLTLLAVRLLHFWQDQMRAVRRRLAAIPLCAVHQYWARLRSFFHDTPPAQGGCRGTRRYRAAARPYAALRGPFRRYVPWRARRTIRGRSCIDNRVLALRAFVLARPTEGSGQAHRVRSLPVCRHPWPHCHSRLVLRRSSGEACADGCFCEREREGG